MSKVPFQNKREKSYAEKTAYVMSHCFTKAKDGRGEKTKT